MQISLESTGKLERRITVRIPAERVEDELARHGNTVTGGDMRGLLSADVLNPIVKMALQEALDGESLRPAGSPDISCERIRRGEPLEFNASFEIYPDIELRPLTGVVIERPVVKIGAEDVEAMLTRLRTQQATWETVGRAARLGDQVTVDYEGKVDGRGYAGSRGSATQIVLGSGTMVEGFEEGLAGALPGERRKLDLRFPDDYFNKEVAGKSVEYSVLARSIAERVLPVLDDEFVKSFGVDGGVPAFREQIRTMMENELEQAARTHIKEQVLDALLAAHDVEVPEALIRSEIGRLKQQAVEHQDAGTLDSELPDTLFEAQGNRLAVTGLLLAEVIRKYCLQVDEDQVNRHLDRLAANYEDPQKVLAMYRSDPEEMKNIEGLVLEGQAVECLLEQADIRETPMNFFDLVK